jgi:hypothetical protein
MADFLGQIVAEFAERASGPMKFRLLLQPAMATIFAVISGIKDAKAGKPPYFWALFSDPSHRREMLQDGWKSVGTVFLLALALDVAYQIIVTGAVRPFEALIVAFILAILPYLALRGLVTRIWRLFQ